MYLKKLVAIFLTLLFTPTFAAAGWAATGNVPTTENSATAGPETTESLEKTEEQPAFCSATALLKSDFIRTSVWPGIGPFDIVGSKDSDSANVHKSVKLADPSNNQFNYTTKGNEINACELDLHNSVGEEQGLLNLQIGTDFLLEGLGIKPGQIHIVNLELSKKSKLLTGNNYNPVSMIIAPLTVSFQNLGKKEDTGAPLFRVAILNQPKLAEKAGTAEPVQVSDKANTESNKTGEIDTAGKVEPKNEISSIESSPEKDQTHTEDSATVASPPLTVKNHATESGAPPTETSSSKALSKDELLKKQFLDLIVNWQRIKKTAVRQQQTNELSQALAGKALTRQSEAIKWLAGNHKYYEMISQGATLEHFDSLIPGKKYAVFVEVKEKSRYIDESGKQKPKETDDTYKVNYTIEKIGQHWLITDSALIKQGTKKSGQSNAKPSAKSKH